jgi:hypothetical protein
VAIFFNYLQVARHSFFENAFGLTIKSKAYSTVALFCRCPDEKALNTALVLVV